MHLAVFGKCIFIHVSIQLALSPITIPIFTPSSWEKIDRNLEYSRDMVSIYLYYSIMVHFIYDRDIEVVFTGRSLINTAAVKSV